MHVSIFFCIAEDRQVGFVCIDENLNRAEEVVGDLLTASENSILYGKGIVRIT